MRIPVTTLLLIMMAFHESSSGIPIKKRNCDEICPENFVDFLGHCYQYFGKETTWSEAEENCKHYEGHLASVPSAEVNNFIISLIKKSNGNTLAATWLGGYNTVKDGTFMWTDGSKFGFQHWNENQPDNYGGYEHCVHIIGGNTGVWNDLSCSTKLAYVCAI
ncbi:alpha-N-acetylgalactosamine-specific lectin-like isoform X2 [Erpetoichthys calabaricus]|uniref:alpha-N-acetylgalactosamine-specific lectin-like isoform X2 n=1 Tax=Erpetoichthys calabaricus TaxID=27687 RepID=UPI0022346109|nr:alpha-N-acetylgalactosamine-specific lectin-like isoform X2 [Erpetoichthys calabaricus]